MEARAILRYARISPRKVSIVMDLIRNKPLDEALAILQYTPKAACEPLLKLVKSAAANAENNFNMDKNNLYVAECYVCPGPTLKRMMPRAQGRGYRILKRTSHMTVVLKEKEIHNSTATNLFILFPPFILILFCSSPLAPFTLFSLLFVV